MLKNIKAPSDDQIRDNAKVAEDEHEVAYACWYPQMGGYGGKCVVIFSKQSDELVPCFDALVWHNGKFPFGDDRAPREIHHCSARQFVEFGKCVQKLQCDRKPKGVGAP